MVKHNANKQDIKKGSHFWLPWLSLIVD